MTEMWRPVPGYAKYEASDLGRIRSLYTTEPRLLKPWLNKGRGYLNVSAWTDDGHRRVMCVHRLVLLAFAGPLPKGMVSRHLDGDPLNNRLSNLKYGSYSENEHDKVRHGGNHNAAKTHCIHGHEFTPENTDRWGAGRSCRSCRQRRQRVGADA